MRKLTFVKGLVSFPLFYKKSATCTYCHHSFTSHILSPCHWPFATTISLRLPRSTVTYLLSNAVDSSQSLRLPCMTECSVLEMLAAPSFHGPCTSPLRFFFTFSDPSFLVLFLKIKIKKFINEHREHHTGKT